MPVFLGIVSLLIAVFFFSIGEVTRKAAEAVNRGSSEHMLEVIDHALRSVEQMMIKELGSKDGIQPFYNPTLRDDPYRRMVEPSERLRDLVLQYPLIHSMYMVRWDDRMVLTDNAAVALEQFADRSFVEAYMQRQQGTGWTASRAYREFASQNAVDVVTLVKPYPVPAGNQGGLVVNVRTAAIAEEVGDTYGTGFIYALLEDRNGVLLGSSFPRQPYFDSTFTEARSAYSGLIIKSRLQVGAFYQFSSRFNRALLACGIVAVIVAIFYIVYISRRNYLPLRSLTERVHAYARVRADQLLKSGGKDEFTVIDQALDRMIEQSDELATQREEHWQIRRRQWIRDTLEGDNGTPDGRWAEAAERLGWRAERTAAFAFVLELDRYAEFCGRYSKRDQSLLKFVLGNVAEELAERQGMQVFGEWLFPDKWCAFTYAEQAASVEQTALLAQQLVSWIDHNLDFRATLGLGEIVAGAERIPASYAQALDALQYKITFGSDRVIGYWEVPNFNDRDFRRQLADNRELVHMFKLGEDDWEAAFQRFMGQLQTSAAPRGELLYQIDYLVFQLSNELLELHSDYQAIWLQETVPAIRGFLKRMDALDELREGLRAIMAEAFARMKQVREERTRSTTMKNVRQYIADHFNNPDLSLNHLSDAFAISPKYVSQLFKEEFGDKFIDYVTNIRMEKAKQLLVRTNLPIQDVAEQVGYLHSFSFIRVFKKAAGMTPGDYRKHMQ
ncbi:helix-turn-helix domain-containing protein [Paenibacillus koleovorans]|uniref:helix-turn-helix domain-containing protein n=1 Tax=Paenibacillus koleovorans TaxID=121608 RepID=UPI000FD98B2C|nr:helix-turn-helix domain-containing protein [Paenibacillus koleovorans]